MTPLQDAPDRQWMSPADVAKMTGFSYHWVHCALRSGRLKGTQPGGRRGKWRISREQVEDWMNGETAAA